MNGVNQIDKFRNYTNNFTNVDILTPSEILYLNLCTWLHPYAQEINIELQAKGKIYLIDKVQGVETYFNQFDIFESFFGEIEPASIPIFIKSGHYCLPELQAAFFDTAEVTAFGNKFFNMEMKPLFSLLNKYKCSAFFPYGEMPKDCSNMILNAIQNHKLIECCDISLDGKYTFNIIDQFDQKFRIYVKNNIAKFHPMQLFSQ